jgi:proteasome lid subunit RPN8/RPN11
MPRLIQAYHTVIRGFTSVQGDYLWLGDLSVARGFIPVGWRSHPIPVTDASQEDRVNRIDDCFAAERGGAAFR